MTCTIASSGEELFHAEMELQILRQRIALLLLNLHKQGYTDFYVNCEYGIPLWTAELICQMKKRISLRLHIAAPHEEQCNEWLESHRDRYMSVHAQADTVVFVSHPQAVDSYWQANKYMIEHSQLLLIYDPEDTATNIEEYAADLGVPVQKI